MIKIATRLMAGTVALGLVAAPIMVQANTRAGDSTNVYSINNAAPGLGRSSDGEDVIAGLGLGALLIGGFVTTLVVVAAANAAADDETGDDGCTSPGGC